MKAFLEKNGWADARREPLAGDASARRYIRLIGVSGSAILMEDPEGDVALFARLARHLTSIGLSAPRILGEDSAAGLLLIEDLGDGLIARLASDAASEERLYLMATDALLALHKHAPPPGLETATPGRLADMIDLAFDFYAPGSTGKDKAIAVFQSLLTQHAPTADVMILRDYHAENILDLPDRTGPARAGLLDFQDALIGHRGYDLISLLEDARRDVRPETVTACIRHYLDASNLPEDSFRAALAVLGAQRNLRILGVFARLAAARGKPHYIDLIPRVWSHLQNDLKHPAMAPLRPVIANLPAPTPDHLERLKAACPTP
ncbi:aminoglycoside phosphotransferase family protein [Pacificoceanicola onchidii]|uniref:aminoglycoside phosphotransferase family protein n=1 Tax=Pacificoceanicola onchidii TaxID=2562685 RepID=UPI0010A64934|nr:phosphotransferase [Pacificoceanicola onchidii]